GLPDRAAAPPAPEPVAPPAPAPSAAVGVGVGGGADGQPLAGYHGGAFYVRDPHDNFRLYFQGRAQIDTFTYFGPGVSSTSLKPTFFLRRIRPELSGEFLKQWQWMLAGDWGGPTSVDNGKATNQTAAGSPGNAPSPTSAKYSSAQTPSIKAQPTDVFLIWHPSGLFNVQMGQFDAPFTQENRTSDKYIPFMERSLAVRDLGIPTNKEIGIMFWGEDPKSLAHYELGPFLGDGQNRPNVDARFDFMGRVFVHPLAGAPGAIKDLQLGASIRTGDRDPKSVNYDYNAFTTQGTFAFWSPTYSGSKGTTHVIPAGNQFGAAGEARIPISIFDLTSEFVYVDNGTREAVEGFQSTNTERFGSMSGYSYYVQLGVWPLGNRDVNGKPGYEMPTHVDLSKADPLEPKQALQLLVKWEQLHVKYASATQKGSTPDPKNIDGLILANVFEVGANYWATKHVRLTVNYAYDMFPGSAPVKPTTSTSPAQTADQRAVAPGNTLSPGVDDAARDGAHVLHELLFRVAVAM
ncbi:MAG TPA: porin, partial [Minicystis sp.]|nr:porin [Minicystis sp.]